MKSFDDWILADTELTYYEWLDSLEAKEKTKLVQGYWNTLYTPGLIKEFSQQRTGISDIELGCDTSTQKMNQ